MMKVQRDLFRHMEWADAEVWRALRAHPAAFENEQLFKVLQHLHVVQRAFHLMWTGGAIDPAVLYAKKDVATLLAETREWYATANEYLANFDDARADETMFMPSLPMIEQQVGRSLQQPTFGESFLQVTTHSAYHRGQVNLRLRESGGEPPTVDYVAWVWFGKPAPNWP
jgi:uncharacterized damage-inducible protein DinB